jgi:hypothetical protein
MSFPFKPRIAAGSPYRHPGVKFTAPLHDLFTLPFNPHCRRKLSPCAQRARLKARERRNARHLDFVRELMRGRMQKATQTLAEQLMSPCFTFPGSRDYQDCLRYAQASLSANSTCSVVVDKGFPEVMLFAGPTKSYVQTPASLARTKLNPILDPGPVKLLIDGEFIDPDAFVRRVELTVIKDNDQPEAP